MDSKTRSTALVAATLSGFAFISLSISIPLMLNSVFELETDFASQRQIYMELSNKMWQDLMIQNNKVRTLQSQSRQKRQCKLFKNNFAYLKNKFI